MAAPGASDLRAAAGEVAGTAGRSPAFVAMLVLTLAAAGFSGFMVVLMALRLDALLPGAFARMGHFTEPHHRMHEVTFAVLFIPPVLGLLAQFRRPSTNVAGMLTTMVPPAALVAVTGATVAQGGNLSVLQPPWVIVMAGALLATALHPAGGDFFRSFRRSRSSWTMLALVAVAAVPLLSSAITNVRLQASVTDDHAAAGHYGFMAAVALATLGLGALASARPDGWRITAWCAGLLPMSVGATSLAYPDATSSLDLPWALAAMAWAALFVGVAQMSTPHTLLATRTTSH